MKINKRYIENGVMALSASVIITTVLWVFPRYDYYVGAVSRGFPFAWYIKFKLEGSSPSFYFDRYLLDVLLTFLVVLMVLIEYYALRKLWPSAAKKRAEKAERKKAEAVAKRRVAKEKKATAEKQKSVKRQSLNKSRKKESKPQNEEGTSVDTSEKESLSMAEIESILVPKD